MQKLVYYAQGFHLAIYDNLLFQEPLEAWMHGPVVKELYHNYKKRGELLQDILPLEEVDFGKYDQETKELLDEVWEVYGQFSAGKLRDMVYQELPWKEASNKGFGSEISPDTMKTFFKSLLVSGDQS